MSSRRYTNALKWVPLWTAPESTYKDIGRRDGTKPRRLGHKVKRKRKRRRNR
jgi:hypothetical protein